MESPLDTPPPHCRSTFAPRGHLLVSLVVYATILLDADVAFLGFFYLALVVCFVLPFQNTVPLWVVAVGDIIAQSLLPFVYYRWPAILSEDVLDALRVIVGIDSTARGWALLLRLLRPIIFLSCLYVTRAKGRRRNDVVALAAHPPSYNDTLSAFLQRCTVLFSSKLLVITLFAAAMQFPSLIGWVLAGTSKSLQFLSSIMFYVIFNKLPSINTSKFTHRLPVGCVVVPPLFTTSNPTPEEPAAQCTIIQFAMLACVQVLTSAWLLLQYAALIPWVRTALLPTPFSTDLLHWIGIDAAEANIYVVERLLRWKVLMLVVLIFKRLSLQWLQEMPRHVREQGHCYGAACALFASRNSSSAVGFVKYWLERSFFADFGLDISLFMLLLAAFVNANLLSQFCIAAVAFGMVCGCRLSLIRRRFWRWILIPYLGLFTLWQYSLLVDTPPLIDVSEKSLCHNKWWKFGKDVCSWLALVMPAKGDVWVLFTAFSAATMQMYQEFWEANRHMDAEGNETPTPFAPLTFAAKSYWRWHDWMRYIFYRRYLDALLIIVIVFCTIENDIIHAGYLAISLWFFRSRIALRKQRNSAFFVLPVYNIFIMVITLAYQAPVQDIWDWPLDEGRTCTLAHLLGLYKLNKSARPTRSFSGVAADVVLWAFIRVQTHMFSSIVYEDAVRVAERDEEMERAQRAADAKKWKDGLAVAAVKESIQRVSRAKRIKKIKEGVDRSLDRFGAGINPTVLDFAFLEEKFFDADGQGQDSALNSSGNEKASTSGGGGKARLREKGGSTNTPRDERRDSAYQGDDVWQDRREDTREGEPESQSSTSLALQLDRVLPTHGSSSLAAAIVPSASFASKFLGTFHNTRDSYIAYTLFTVAYLSDLSILTLVLPASAFFYALVSVRPSRVYWHSVLLYCEVIIIVSYAFQVPARLGCGFISSSTLQYAEMLGIHINAARTLPLFLVYLATLRHTHGLMTRRAAKERSSRKMLGEENVGGDALGSLQSQDPRVAAGQYRNGESAEDDARIPFLPSSEEAISQPIVYYTFKGWQELAARWLAALRDFTLIACTRAERPPCFILVDLKVSEELKNILDLDNSIVRQELQAIIDGWRDVDLEHAQTRLQAIQSSAVLNNRGNDAEQPLLWSGTGGPHRAVDSRASSNDVVPDAAIDLSNIGPLWLSFHSIIDTNVDPLQVATSNQGEEEKATQYCPHMVKVLLEVIPLTADPGNTPGICQFSGWPGKSLKPAHDACVTLMRSSNQSSSPQTVEITAAEPHSAQARDYYAATAALDFAGFIFVGLYYNKVVHAAGSLSEVTSEHIVPLGYLITLMVLFFFVVMDRVIYTIGSQAGKALLHLTEMFMYYWFVFNLVWSSNNPYSSYSTPLPLGHLRTLLVVKSLSFALSALQLRTGYPPATSYANGLGRHTFVFMRSVSVPSSVAFQVFTAIPFLYEMRQLLDWACTPTTLTLHDWLKLEDIVTSLYFSAVMRKSKERKPLGVKQPRYLKILQGGVLFVGLLLLLWVPLLLFSTGNPTYQVPAVQGIKANLTLQSSQSLAVPLYQAGQRGSWWQWGGVNGTLPAALAYDYIPEQLQCLSVPPDADDLWKVSPPLLEALKDALSHASVYMRIGYTVKRNLPPPSEHGGPLCEGSVAIPLANVSKEALLQVIDGTRDAAPLLRSHDDQSIAHPSALHPLFWVLRGDVCTARPLESEDFRRGEIGLPGRKTPLDLTWADRWIACNASFKNKDQESWWRLDCGIVDSNGTMVYVEQSRDNASNGGLGLMLIALVDRVQSGIIGATVSKYGVLGLYTVFVYGVGRFLRLSVTNLRMRIPFEDLPTTRRLVALCQDIYIARAEGLLALEEELYGALLAVYRLPSVMYELTMKER